MSAFSPAPDDFGQKERNLVESAEKPRSCTRSDRAPRTINPNPKPTEAAMNNKLMTIAAIGIAFAGLGTTDTVLAQAVRTPRMGIAQTAPVRGMRQGAGSMQRGAMPGARGQFAPNGLLPQGPGPGLQNGPLPQGPRQGLQNGPLPQGPRPGLQNGPKNGPKEGLKQGKKQGKKQGGKQGGRNALQRGPQQGFQQAAPRQGFQRAPRQGFQRGLQQAPRQGFQRGPQQGFQRGLQQGFQRGMRGPGQAARGRGRR